MRMKLSVNYLTLAATGLLLFFVFYRLSQLTRLELSDGNLEDLADPPCLVSLKELCLTGVKVTSQWLKELPVLVPCLTFLKLTRNSLSYHSSAERLTCPLSPITTLR